MKISYNWLKQYIDISEPPGKIAEILTAIGLEVENTETWSTVEGDLEGIVVGKVLTRNDHPNADRLCITEVDIGTGELLNIVFGAPNVEAGQKVLVATVGTTLISGNEKFTIKRTKIRGRLSEGMICAEDEIGLGTSHDGIMVLNAKAPVGTPAAEYLKIEQDTVFEIGLTPNRIDAASHFGVARDLAAFFRQSREVDMKRPEVENFSVDNNDLVIPVEVENKEACPRYTGVTIKGVRICASPEWLKNRLKSIGLKPINNVVDITNFVLHETGQPLHAFDADSITGNKVIVKTLPKGTKFITLDEEERELSPEDLMICNAKEGMCIAGVFGGIGSGVTENTHNVFLECANFNPVWIRKTARRHGLATDSSFRFERGADPNCTVYVIKRAANLIKELAGGTISSDITDIYPVPVEDFPVELSWKNLDTLIGNRIERGIVRKILNSLDIRIGKENENGLSLRVPTYRTDVRREADVIEEILRIYGYNTVVTGHKVNSSIAWHPKPDKEKIRNTISGWLAANGFLEIWNNSLTKSSYCEQCKAFDPAGTVRLFNPLSADLDSLRQTLLFGGLETMAFNANRRNHDLKLFEFGTVYSFKKQEQDTDPQKQYMEAEHLALFITGRNEPVNWNTGNRQITFFDLKAFTESVMNRLGIRPEGLDTDEIRDVLFSEGLHYNRRGQTYTVIGKLADKILKMTDIGQDVYYADIYWDNLLAIMKDQGVAYKELPKFPEVRRDLALLLDKNIRFSQIRELAMRTERSLLKNVFLFDVYEGENITPGKKSYATGFILQDKESTLTDKRIEKVMNTLMNAFERELGAVIR
ncbi:MAG: phenylalanine--tRNA ligase subunit beta [Bacteroidetes bacterium]|nr:phenylalanine--tRNA ligase subunit beta [Bacteroidota bacterium]